MLSLDAPTSERWLNQVRPHRDELLIDHAHCEKKAASTAMGLIFAYVEEVALVGPLAEIVTSLDSVRSALAGTRYEWMAE